MSLRPFSKTVRTLLRWGSLGFLASAAAWAQLTTLELRGTITSGTSPLFTPGDPAVLRLTFSTTVDTGGLEYLHYYAGVDSSLTVGDTIFTLVQPLPYVSTRPTVAYPSYVDGMGNTYYGNFAGFYGLGIQLYSFSGGVTTPDGLLMPGLSLADFDRHRVRFYDEAITIIGEWNITHYAYTPGRPMSPVPEASTWALGAVSGLALAILVRRRRRPTLALPA